MALSELLKHVVAHLTEDQSEARDGIRKDEGTKARIRKAIRGMVKSGKK